MLRIFTSSSVFLRSTNSCPKSVQTLWKTRWQHSYSTEMSSKHKEIHFYITKKGRESLHIQRLNQQIFSLIDAQSCCRKEINKCSLMFNLIPIVSSQLCVAGVQLYIPCSSGSCCWKLSNHRDGTPRFDKQRLRVPSSSQPASHLFNPQAFYLDTQDSLVSVKSYRSESHIQSVSVSGMNYTAWDVFLYTCWAPMFHIVHASLKQGNDVFSSFWASNNSSHNVPVVISPNKTQPLWVCVDICVFVCVLAFQGLLTCFHVAGSSQFIVLVRPTHLSL